MKVISRFLGGAAFLTLAIFMVTGVFPASATTAVFINEIHYDNVGSDAGEAIEIAGPAGTDLTGWNLVLYNGANGAVYDTITLSGVIPDQQAGYGTLAFPRAGIQNGSPDGMALIDAASNVVQFLSYEGTFDAVGGPANGITSTDIGVAEGSSTPLGESLQLAGSGITYEDFAWASPSANSFGFVNPGQTFSTSTARPMINEFVFNHTGTDTNEYVEIYGSPEAEYSAYALLQIEGDSSGAGVIDSVIPLSSTDASGFWFTGFLNNTFENGTATILLVEDFSGNSGEDLDTNNDGVFESMPWSEVVDGIAITDGGSSDRTYAETTLVANFDGGAFTVGGASRIPNGFDSNSAGDWVRNDFDGYGLPGFTGTQAIGEAVNTPGAENAVITVIVDEFGACGEPATFIHVIQGNGFASTEIGNIRVVEGVVVGDFDQSNQLRGFFLQEEDADADSDPQTSEGIFVYKGSFGSDVSSGDVVRVRGTVTEYFGLTELTSLLDLEICPTGGTVTPANISLPVAGMEIWEQAEGMLVEIDQELTVTGNYTLGRYGEVDLSADGRLFNPTNIVEPGSTAQALQAANDLRRIQLDDGRTAENPEPLPPYFGPDGTLRAGDTTPGLIGALSYSFNSYEIHPVEPVTFVRENDRPYEPPDVGGEITVASFNVLNYFTTIDNGTPICGPASNLDCRGADTYEEFVRQREKIIAAIVDMDADVVGLMEIENHPDDAAVADLVQGLNDAAGAGTYDYIATGPIGTDAIKLALIYQPASVTPYGTYAILDSGVDSRFLDEKNRPVLAQAFADGDGALFTVAVNHLKSKGSDCLDVGDPDLGDGQGNCNLTRLHAAQALADWLASDPTGSGDADAIIIGDLNSYAMEDPIDALEAAGYTNLIAEFGGQNAYSYVFEGQAGYLDHALANSSLMLQVTGNAVWHINADEPVALDYNNYNQPALYHADPFASSDHDPVLTGLSLNLPPVCSGAYPSVAELWPANHKFVSLEILGLTDPDGDMLAVTIESIFQDEAVDDGGDGSSAPDAMIGEAGIFELRAERAGEGDGRVYHVFFTADDGHSGTCSGEVLVSVPHDSNKNAEPAADGGALFDSTLVPEPEAIEEMLTTEAVDPNGEAAPAPTPEAVGKEEKEK